MRSYLVLLPLLLAVGCKSRNDPPPATPTTTSATCRDGVGDDVQLAGRTAGAAAKTGITTAGDGIVQAGSATAGLFEGGTDEAGRRWHQKGNETKATARKGAAETREEASVPPCK